MDSAPSSSSPIVVGSIIGITSSTEAAGIRMSIPSLLTKSWIWWRQQEKLPADEEYNHAMHRTAGPGTSLAPERGRPRRDPAGPGPRQDHPPVMGSVGHSDPRPEGVRPAARGGGAGHRCPLLLRSVVRTIRCRPSSPIGVACMRRPQTTFPLARPSGMASSNRPGSRIQVPAGPSSSPSTRLSLCHRNLPRR